MALVVRRLVRGFGLRCPHCGARGVTRHWLEVVAVCPACRLRLDRGEPDYWLGALLFNLIAAEILFAAGVLGVLVITWPDPPWDTLLWGGIPVMVIFPIITYPVSKLVWLGFDLIFRPATPDDFAPPSAAPGPVPAPPGGDRKGR
jgi:uncharacterized protein (DUF983 family)